MPVLALLLTWLHAAIAATFPAPALRLTTGIQTRTGGPDDDDDDDEDAQIGRLMPILALVIVLVVVFSD